MYTPRGYYVFNDLLKTQAEALRAMQMNWNDPSCSSRSWLSARRFLQCFAIGEWVSYAHNLVHDSSSGYKPLVDIVMDLIWWYVLGFYWMHVPDPWLCVFIGPARTFPMRISRLLRLRANLPFSAWKCTPKMLRKPARWTRLRNLPAQRTGPNITYGCVWSENKLPPFPFEILSSMPI